MAKARMKADKEEVAKVSQLNLTNLTHSISPEDPDVFFNAVNRELTVLNEIAKPGGGQELTLCRGGRIEWAHYDSMGEYSAAVTFTPGMRNKLLIEVPKGTMIEVREITKLP